MAATDVIDLEGPLWELRLTTNEGEVFKWRLQSRLFDGHNGSAAAIYAKENLSNNVLSAIPSDLTSEEWVSALPRALVAGFVKTDKDFQEKVGDSRGVLESAEGAIHYLSADHRLNCSEED